MLKETLYSPLVILVVGALVALAVLLAIGKVPLRYNLRNLSARWRTTVLTALAFTLVVSLLTVMLAFVNGMYRLTEGSGEPGNVIVLSKDAPDEVMSNLPRESISDIANQPGIVRDAGGKPLASPETYVIVNQPVPNAASVGPQRRFLQVRGIEDAIGAAKVHAIRLYPDGVWFSEAGVEELPAGIEGWPPRSMAVQVVLGEGIARVLARDRTVAQRDGARRKDRLDAGDIFVLGDRPWIVKGVMQSSGSTFDSEVWAKRSLIGPMFGKDAYTSVVVRADDASVAQRLKKFFTSEYKKADVQAQVETEYFASLTSTSKQFLWAIIFVAVVMSVGGVFGVMNTMLAAISQRTKDIGVLRLLGYKRRQILVCFLLESLVIALLGGLLGCAIGSLADGWTANSIVGSGQGGGKFVVLKLAVDADILAAGLLLSLGMGVAGGLFPSLYAMRLTPLDALR